MYKRKLFESIQELVLFLNSNNINPSEIISIMPFQTNNDSYSQLRREYEMIYVEQKGE